MDEINNKLDDKESKEGIRRIFDSFIGDPNADTITLSSLKKISKELGENMSDEELKMKNLRLCWKEQVKMELNSPSIQSNYNYLNKHTTGLFQKSFKIIIIRVLRSLIILNRTKKTVLYNPILVFLIYFHQTHHVFGCFIIIIYLI